MHFPAGTRNEKFIWQTHTANDTTRYDVDVREAHAILGTEPNDTLARVKLNYLLRCRMFHPEAGGNAAMFYKITLAYERIMHDRGVESRHGRIAFSDMLPPRPKFDETPLLDENEREADIQELIEAGETLNGKPVPWAKNRWIADGNLGARDRDRMTSGNEKPAALLARTEENAKQEAIEAAEHQKALEAGDPHALAVQANALAEVKKDPLADLLGPTDVTETDVAFFPDGGIVEIKPPKTALFNQKPLAQLSDEALMRRWVTAGERLTHDEEEATARELIERSIKETGGALSKQQEEFLLMHLVERSDSVAGQAARAATDAMWHVEERKQVVREFLVLICMMGPLIFGMGATYASYVKYIKDKEERPQLQDHINADTMLPWWGNDGEYEKTVKRLFVEEWRRARGAAQRITTFSAGVAREGLESNSRYTLDTEIFEVTSQRLDELRRRLAKGKESDVVSEAVPVV